MGAQIGPAVNSLMAWLATDQAAAVIVRTILINVALGSLSFDADGDTWEAIDEG